MATASTAVAMAEQLVPDEVWGGNPAPTATKRSHPKGGRLRIEDRAALGDDSRVDWSRAAIDAVGLSAANAPRLSAAGAGRQGSEEVKDALRPRR